MKPEQIFEMIGVKDAAEVAAIARGERTVNVRMLPRTPTGRLSCLICQNPIGVKSCKPYQQSSHENNRITPESGDPLFNAK